MKLEQRYVVIKLTDIKATDCTEAEIAAFNDVCDRVSRSRIQRGKGLLECMVIEKDWPEFAPTLALLSARVDGEQAGADAPRDFVKIVRASNGQQVLYCVEPDDGDYVLHQVAYVQDGILVRIGVEFRNEPGTMGPSHLTEERAFAALEKASTETADLFLAMVAEMMAEGGAE